MSFSPPANARRSAVRPEEGWHSCGWRMLEKWLSKQGWTYRQLAEALGCSTGTIGRWKNGSACSALHLGRIEQLCSVPPEAWVWWTQDESLEAEAEDGPADSGPRVTAAIDLPELRSETEELRESVARAKLLLKHPEISVKQRLDAEGRIQVGLSTLARVREQRKLEEHPEFEAFSEMTLAAVEATLEHYGLSCDGARTVFAEHLERLEAERQRRAA